MLQTSKAFKMNIFIITKKLDVLRGRLSGSQNDFHWQLDGNINHQPCSRKQLETLMHRAGQHCFELLALISSRSGVEDTRLEDKAKDTKKIRKDNLSEDRPSRAHGHECSRSRSRTKDTAASVLQKKGLQKVFQAISNS